MSESLWTRDFILDTWINFMLYIIFYLLMLWSTSYAIAIWHSSISSAGLASSIFIVGALIARFVSGQIIDAYGRKKLLVIGTAVFLATIPCYFFVTSMGAFCLVRIIHGAAYGVSATATGTIIGAIVPISRHGEGLGFFALGNTLGTAIGPFLAITLSIGGNYFLSLYLCIALAILAFFTALFLHCPEYHGLATLHHSLKNFQPGNYFSIRSLPISITAAICSVAYSAVLSFIGVYSAALGLLEGGSLFYVVYAVTAFFSRPMSGRILDRFGGNVVLYPVFILLALSMAVLAIASTNIYFIIAGILLGLSYSTLNPVGQALAIHGVPSNQIGLATSTFFVLVEIGVGIGPYTLGILTPAYGFSSVYYLACGVIVLALPFYYLLVTRKGIYSRKWMHVMQHRAEFRNR